jgi:hypothetical protein
MSVRSWGKDLKEELYCTGLVFMYRGNRTLIGEK